MKDKNNATLSLAIMVPILAILIAGILILAYDNEFNLDKITGHKIGVITTQPRGDYEFKFITTQNDTLSCVYPAPVATPIATKAAIEMELLTTEKPKPVTLYGKKKGKKFIIHKISN